MSELHAPLLSWYDRARRRLPWREEVSPYRTWVSEIMLQQTQVAAVIPYYERFLARFPDVRSLAAAREEEVLRLWAGLGYYSRARNLLAAAREVQTELDGRIPDDVDGLMSLPGIGRYTAGAIASIAFGRPRPLVDGNVVRVFARLFALRGDAKSPALQKKVWALAERHLEASRPGDWNQALMELGARVCLPAPETPLCAGCPLAGSCSARRLGLAESLPEAAAQRAPVAMAWTALRIEDAGRLLLWKRSEDERFLRGHWGLPEARHLPGARPGAVIARVRHSITHHRITLTLRGAAAPRRLPKAARWVPAAEASAYLVSSIWRKALKKVP